MSRVRWALLIAALVGCEAVSTSAPTAAPTPAAATLEVTAAPTVTPAATIPTQRLAATEVDLGALPGYLTLFADVMVGTVSDVSGTEPRQTRIFERAYGAASPRVLYRSAATAIDHLRVSRDWIAWIEYADMRGASDAKIYAMPRPGGARVLVADPLHAADLWGRSFDMSLDGSTVYWTVSRMIQGAWRGELWRRKLPSAAPELVFGTTRSLVTAPVASGDVLVYTETEQGDYPTASGSPGPQRIVRRPGGAGAPRVLADGFAPSIGDGFIAFFDRASGQAAALLDDGRIVRFGPSAESLAPQAWGEWMLWYAPVPFWEDGVYVARPRDGCFARIAGGRRDLFESGGYIGAGRVAWERLMDEKTNRRVLELADLAQVRCN